MIVNKYFKKSLGFFRKIHKPKTKLLLILAIVCFTIIGSVYLSNNTKKPTSQTTREIDRLTDKLQQLNKQVSETKQPKVEAVQEMVVVAQKRAEELVKQARKDPQGFLEAANLASQRDVFSEEVKQNIEQEVEIEASIGVVHADIDSKDKATVLAEKQYYYFLEKAGKQVYNLQFASNPPNLYSGTFVKAKGIAIKKELVLGTGDSQSHKYNLKVLAGGGGGGGEVEEPPTDRIYKTGNPIGEQKTAIFMVSFSDTPFQSHTKAQVTALMFGQGESIDAYYQENSFNKAHFTGDVFDGIIVTPSTDPYEACNFVGWSDAAEAIVSATTNLDNYTRKVFLFPGHRGCFGGTIGLGEVGGEPSRSWVFYTNFKVVAHELGHNLGLGHASHLNCESKSVEDYDKCYKYEYGDPYDVMGYGWSSHFNSAYKVALGWIPPANVVTVTKKGIYKIHAGELATNLTQVLKIPKPNTDEFYYISYRKKIGFDSGMYGNIDKGASVHIWDDYGSTNTKFINTNPGAYSDNSAMTDGQIFHDQQTNITIKQLSHDSDSVTIEITTPAWLTDRVKDFKSIKPLPRATYGHGSVAVNGYLYVLGGVGQNYYPYRSTVYYAKINQDGTIGDWLLTTNLPEARSYLSVVSNGDYIYTLGGIDTSYYNKSAVYYTKVNSDGSLDPWISGTTLPQNMFDASAVVANGYIYMLGGRDDSYNSRAEVYMAKINEDGSIGEWVSVTPLPQAASQVPVAFANGYLYTVGGYEGYTPINNVYAAEVKNDGSLGSWKSVNSLKSKRSAHQLISSGGYIFTLGGVESFNYKGEDPIYYYNANARGISSNKAVNNGTLMSWLADYPTSMRLLNSAATTYNGYIFILGGQENYYITNKAYSLKVPFVAANLPAVGNFESITQQGEVSGWAYDPDDPDKKITVEFFMDTAYHKDTNPTPAFFGVTEIEREDVNSGRYLTGSHGFKIAIPEQFKDKEYLIHAYAVDSQTGVKHKITNSPKSSSNLNLSPIGVFETITSDGYLVGWAYDPNETSKSITVEFYVGAPLESNATSSATISYVTDIERKDINQSRTITGKHGFKIAIPNMYKDGVYRPFFAYVVDTQNGNRNRMSNSIRYYPVLATPSPSGAGSSSGAFDSSNSGSLESSNSASPSGVLGEKIGVGFFNGLKGLIQKVFH